MVLDNIPELESYTLKPDDLNEVTVDNSALFDKAQENQALSTEQIIAMQKSNVSGADLVDLLSKNSTNFAEKSGYSQDKFIKKKEKKHIKYFTILDPTPRLLAQVYSSRAPHTIQYLGTESLAFMNCYLNVHPGVKIAVAENCSGLCSASLVWKGANVTQFNENHDGCNNHAFEVLNLGAEKAMNEGRMNQFPLNKVGSLIAGKTELKGVEMVFIQHLNSHIHLCVYLWQMISPQPLTAIYMQF